jgi:hypothetical protein
MQVGVASVKTRQVWVQPRWDNDGRTTYNLLHGTQIAESGKTLQ